MGALVRPRNESPDLEKHDERIIRIVDLASQGIKEQSASDSGLSFPRCPGHHVQLGRDNLVFVGLLCVCIVISYTERSKLTVICLESINLIGTELVWAADKNGNVSFSKSFASAVELISIVPLFQIVLEKQSSSETRQHWKFKTPS